MRKKKILGFVGVIVLGALGSALWELALRPAGEGLWSLGLTIVTLGFSSLRDEIYADAIRLAAGEARSVAITQAIGAVALIGSSILANVLPALLPNPQEPARRRAIGGTCFLLLGFAIVCLGMSVRNGYVAQLSNYYERLQTVAAPYITDEEMKKLRSVHAAGTNRKEYLATIDALRTVAKKNGATFPPLEFF